MNRTGWLISALVATAFAFAPGVSLAFAPPGAGVPDERSAQVPGPTARPVIVLVDSTAAPKVRVEWPTIDGRGVELTADRTYGTDADRLPMGRNVSCFIAAGGTRLRSAAGHPKGAVVRVGFYKIDPGARFFDDLPPDSSVEIILSGVRFNQPVTPRADSPVQHLKYSEDDLAQCGISATARNQYNLYSTTDALNNRIRPGIDTRMGILDGSDPGDGTVTLSTEDDGTVTLRARIPYAILRHLSDPWRSAVPGTFIEPLHFHLEFEVLAEGTPDEPPARID